MRNMLLATAVSVLLAVAPAFAQSAAEAPGQGASGQASESGELPWKAGNQHAAAAAGFYDYIGRVASEGPGVPFIGEAADEHGEGAAFIGWTGGTSGATAGSGSSTNPGSRAAEATSNGQPISGTALAKAAVQWDRSAPASDADASPGQASKGQSRR